MNELTLFEKLFAQVNESFHSFLDQDFNQIFENLLVNSIKILFVILLTWILMKLRSTLANRVFRLTRMDRKKQETLSSLLLSFSKYVILIVSFIIILGYLGVQTAPILASAGILGLAIGFGAQNFVKDLIAGFFMLFEDWMRVGDFVQVGEITGTVEEIGLRSTVIREWSGKQVHLLNSSIEKLTNFNRERMRPIVNFVVSYEFPTAEVERVIKLACAEINEKHEDKLLRNDFGNIVEPVYLYGITDIENNTYGVRYTIVGLFEDQHYWLMGREIRRIVIEHFRREGIQIASPKRIYTMETTNTESTIFSKGDAKTNEHN